MPVEAHICAVLQDGGVECNEAQRDNRPPTSSPRLPSSDAALCLRF